MKTIDLFCASPASTAICSSTDQRSMIRRVTRPIGRHPKALPPIPCQSQPPIDPKPYHQKNRKSTSKKQSDFQRKSSVDKSDLISPPGSSRYLLSDTPFSDMLSDSDRFKALVPSQTMRTGRHGPNDSPSSLYSPRARDSDRFKALAPSHKMRAGHHGLNDSPSSLYSSRARDSDHFKALAPSHKTRAGHLSSPKSSLGGRDSDHVKTLVPSQKTTLGNPSTLKSSSRGQDSDHVKTLVPGQKMGAGDLISADSPSSKSSSSRSCPRDKVVKLKVAIHCKGCEGKVRKHISRMEGVTSFRIDLATKKVTVIGDVTPLGVLTSISRVKNAQFWPSPTSSPSSSSSSSPTVGLDY
ncbi:protein SODIUM POTASSIUM ROOT DEFECTIVE 1-like [Rhododendron vialii]|uniref:protein SODIUM POTASSIUM ROOT DEFECTIVE 1-like n=1 Tax=Rhododendron vialii TaxID=182163 RepID=UPI00265F5B00|nr:protein SODIUM POTASSIUM ROOT DEFECTIVE 1-like [Rhododendron vialii]